ncbi:hypothetical protein ACHAC9_02100 [Massilia sp. CMS3.1]|uniref:hypothetical protein n=1 Tax=Massilia sp. CMS3.1 TaxID=3373083 RepID=UPI003EE5CEA2
METFAQRFATGGAGPQPGKAAPRPGEPGALVADAVQRVLAASNGFYDRTQLAPVDVVGRTLAELGAALTRNAALRQPAGLDIVPMLDANGVAAHYSATLREGSGARRPDSPPRAFNELLDHIPAGGYLLGRPVAMEEFERNWGGSIP